MARVTALFLLIAAVPASHAAVSAPLPPHTDAAAKFKQDCFDAQESVAQRDKVAKERYQAKLDHRASMVAGLKAQLESKKQLITVASDSVVEQHNERPTADVFTGSVVWLLLTIAVFLPVRYFVKARWPQLEPPLRDLHTPVRVPALARMQAGKRIRVPAKPATPLALPPPLRPLPTAQVRLARTRAPQAAAQPASGRGAALALS